MGERVLKVVTRVLLVVFILVVNLSHDLRSRKGECFALVDAVLCPCVCLSVCLSQAGIQSKRPIGSSLFLKEFDYLQNKVLPSGTLSQILD